MRGRRRPVKRLNIFEWYRWYAWRPVRALDKTGTAYHWVWREKVWRRTCMTAGLEFYEAYQIEIPQPDGNYYSEETIDTAEAAEYYSALTES